MGCSPTIFKSKSSEFVFTERSRRFSQGSRQVLKSSVFTTKRILELKLAVRAKKPLVTDKKGEVATEENEETHKNKKEILTTANQFEKPEVKVFPAQTRKTNEFQAEDFQYPLLDSARTPEKQILQGISLKTQS